MNKRTARRLAGVTALSVPAVVAFSAPSHAAPLLATPRANSTVGGRSVTFYAPFHAERPVASAKVFLDGKLLAKQNYAPAGVNGLANVTWDSTSVSSGKYTISVRLYDTAGNIVSQERVPIKVDNGAGTDTIAPQVAIITPKQGEEMRGSIDIKVLATDNSGESPYVSVFVDKQLRGVSNHQPYSYAINTAEYDNGEHLVEAWAYDASQNKGTAEAVRVRFNNPGGATTLNEDVNRMGRAEAAPEPPAATAPALPEVSAPKAAAPTDSVPVVSIPPVPEVKAARTPAQVIAPPAEPAPVAEAPAAPVETLDVQTLSPQPEPTGIQELPAPSAETQQPAATGIQELPVHAEPAGITELPVAEKPRRAEETTARTEKAAPVRVARRPVEAPRKPEADSAAAPKPAAPAAQTVRPEPRAEAPIVLRMKGDQVLPNPPAAPEKARIARAEAAPAKPAPAAAKPSAAPAPAGLKPATPAIAAVPEIENPAPRPQHLAAAPKPTATAVRAMKPARSAAAPKRVARVESPAVPRPAIIPELPADTVQNGRIRHAVRPGETPRQIARAYGVPVKKLIAANNIGKRSPARIGQVLEVPAPVRIALNDTPVQFDVAPRIQNGMTLAALRQVYEQAGGKVTWNAARREVRATGAGANIVVHIGSREAIVNGHKITLDAPAFIEAGRTFLPVRFMVASLGLTAEYDLRAGSINLTAAAKHEPKLA